ncbi:putative baseplate assembly protein [Candidatus Chloroploca sp. M-50]|uniref:Baseplate assembly protein n=1 Tax=Candidatus Chloroploca mongolica TaxID=2528176 RepID=A0ABS4DFW1_9CHLR|nr:putative baseplate assembly protein [Candidatus Chloroploca mongolica]MBP1468337.1 putative baseplate assembly protein [Candidatus Chloroploca mongolica]
MSDSYYYDDEGLRPPEPTVNRAGLPALAYRVGTHASFLATMRARLSSADHPALRGLRTRATDDPAMALLDAWAYVADILSFYNERIINEGYLRTATERRSLVELARLIGYAPRPGVAASVFLAYTVEATATGDVQIGAGARAQSVPGPGEQPQSFETAEPLTARAAWSALKPRTSRPAFIILDQYGPSSLYDARLIDTIFFKGISANLRPGDMLLLVFGDEPGQQVPRKVQAVESLPAENRTKVTLQLLTVEYALQQFLVYWRKIDLQNKLGPQMLEALRTVLSQELEIRPHTLLNELLDSLVIPRHRMEEIIDGLEKAITELEPKPFDTLDDVSYMIKDVSQMDDVSQMIEGVLLIIRDILKVIGDILQNSVSTHLQAKTLSLRDLLEAFLSQVVGEGEEKIPLARLRQAANIVLQLLRHMSIAIPDQPIDTHEESQQEGSSKELFDALRAILVHLRRAPDPPAAATIKELLTRLVQPPSRPPRSAQALTSDTSRIFDGRSDALLGVLAADNPALSDTLAPALAAAAATPPPLLKAAYAMRVKAAPHGNNVPFMSFTTEGEDEIEDDRERRGKDRQMVKRREWGIDEAEDTIEIIGEIPKVPSTNQALLPLDAPYDQITQESWVVIERSNKISLSENRVTTPLIVRAIKAETVGRTAYGFPAKVTQLTLSAPWLDDSDTSLGDIRSTSVYAQGEALELADEPITSELAGGEVELDDFYADLTPGRWLIVSGERADTPGTAGVHAAELVMLAAVRHDAQDAPDQSLRASVGDPSDTAPLKLGGDTRHTTLLFANPLSYRYRRASVTISANVVRATHGESHPESLGGGDGSKPFQRFTLRQGPLTYLAAPSAAGAENTLQVRVNDVLWHPVEQLAALGPNERGYLLQTADSGTVSGVFGDGIHGARPPTGVENIRAVYRTGIGAPGNVRAEQISLLTTRPAGVRAVINPLPASGGANRDGPEAIRTSAPLTVTALDRLVSVQDYTDFARIFAGIGKAHAVRISDGTREVVHLTVAGTDDIPLDRDSDLMRNLKLALRRAGDPGVPLRLVVRRLRMLLIKARVRVHPDYLWEKVEPQVRDALRSTFSFTRRDLGQPAYAADALLTMQQVPGVVYVDLDAFGAVSAQDEHGLPLTPALLGEAMTAVMQQAVPQQAVLAALPTHRALAPAEIMYLVPSVEKTTLLLEELL